MGAFTAGVFEHPAPINASPSTLHNKKSFFIGRRIREGFPLPYHEEEEGEEVGEVGEDRDFVLVCEGMIEGVCMKHSRA